MGEAINPAGWVGGDYVDTNGVSHPMLRAPDGAVTEFEVPGASGYYGAWVDGISGLNSTETIAGAYIEAPANVFHGYVRDPDGTITQIDVAGAGTGQMQGTLTSSINNAGWIVGSSVDTNSVNHGFLRSPDGTITTFDFPHAAQGTVGENINQEGAVVGNYYDGEGAAHGYVRSPKGKFTRFDCPGAGTGAGQGTIPMSNTVTGASTGYWLDANNVYHGFVRE